MIFKLKLEYLYNPLGWCQQGTHTITTRNLQHYPTKSSIKVKVGQYAVYLFTLFYFQFVLTALW